MGVNGQKLNFQANGRRWQEMAGDGVETAWNSLLSVYDIATALSDNIFFNENGSRVKGLPKSRCKWG